MRYDGSVRSEMLAWLGFLVGSVLLAGLTLGATIGLIFAAFSLGWLVTTAAGIACILGIWGYMFCWAVVMDWLS